MLRLVAVLGPAAHPEVVDPATAVHLPLLEGLTMRLLFVYFRLSVRSVCTHRYQQAPNPSNVLGVFGLSIRSTERDLDDEFSRFGRVEKVVIVYDQRVSFPSFPCCGAKTD